MTTIVQQDDYRTDDGVYSVAYCVTYEPKNPATPYRADITVNGKLVTMMAFDHREAAIRYATDSQLHLWQMRLVVPALQVTHLPAQVAPTRQSLTREAFSLTTPVKHVSGDDCACESCSAYGVEDEDDDMTPYERSEAASQRSYMAQRHPQRVFDATPRLFVMDEGGCVSRHPHQCRCGDCLTYLAGE